MTSANIASHVPAMAALDPDRKAIIEPDGRGGWRWVTFRELDDRSDDYARGLEAIGITRGMRTVLMVPPSIDFFALVFGLFKAGVVIVLIDPGIGRRALLKCLDEVEPEAFIGVPAAHVARILFPKPFKKVKSFVTVGRRWFWGGHTAEQVRAAKPQPPSPVEGPRFKMVEPAADETAAILFTSGSTGIPKGAVYSHQMFDAQVRMIRSTYDIRPGEIDLPTFPLFALFDPALGMTAVLPEMDFRYPARAEPHKLIAAIEAHQCTSMFASPALLDNLGRYGERSGVKLGTIKRVLTAGAPVRNDVLTRMTKLLGDDGQVFTPFGATEALPVASIGSKEVLAETAAMAAQGKGVCVGKPVAGTTVRVIRITDEPIEAWSDDLLVPSGEIGEIVVSGPVVTREYFGRPAQTKLAKIKAADGSVMHRMGDVGYLDAQGRLWMCGRKSHRVVTKDNVTHFTVAVEEVFNQHPLVTRTALIGVGAKGRQTPKLLVEQTTKLRLTSALVDQLRELGAKFEATKHITDIELYPEPFPVDARHNAKIEREKLAARYATR